MNSDEQLAARSWISDHAKLETVSVLHDQPWGTVMRIETAQSTLWFKAAGAAALHEAQLTVNLSQRWPNVLPEVVAHQPARGWLLMADAGRSLHSLGDPNVAWITALQSYAEMQVGESSFIHAHLASGVPDLRLQHLPRIFDRVFDYDLPLSRSTIESADRVRTCIPLLVAEIGRSGVCDTIQHDDLHGRNVFATGRIIDWADTSIGFPWATLVSTFEYLKQGDDFDSLAGAYLEPFGTVQRKHFDLIIRLARISHAYSWLAHRQGLEGAEGPRFVAWLTDFIAGAVDELQHI